MTNLGKECFQYIKLRVSIEDWIAELKRCETLDVDMNRIIDKLESMLSAVKWITNCKLKEYRKQLNSNENA